jgi:hypothetical protein
MVLNNGSLIRYNNPVLINSTKDAPKRTSGKSGGKQGRLPPVDNKQPSQTDDILNAILPPRYVKSTASDKSSFVLGKLDVELMSSRWM